MLTGEALSHSLADVLILDVLGQSVTTILVTASKYTSGYTHAGMRVVDSC